ncbi:hypothetical protein ALI144C_37330 [Actinosynnema sp. ALI-1.44]|uniref:SIS domain-containing protein n=1 Tax=Actinosynnema sp. ALI-1.44 TaxID=1933779 RepID=UPI00097C3873|nr:SIS domain-containing protein [Actinosynnema sp. ALI-1.44]ONI76322.1 hypothetical protein ALI144C_37330 [Actinosynnema sp. ALI-1.44]
MSITIQPTAEPGRAAATAARAVLRRSRDAVNTIPDDAVMAAIEPIAAMTGRVIITGVGTSGDLARVGATVLSSCGTPAYFLHATDMLHGASGAVVAGDVLIAVSQSGDTPEVVQSAIEGQQCGAHVIVLTSVPGSALAAPGRTVVVLDLPEEDFPLASTVARTMWFVALAEALHAFRTASDRVVRLGRSDDDL